MTNTGYGTTFLNDRVGNNFKLITRKLCNLLKDTLFLSGQSAYYVGSQLIYKMGITHSVPTTSKKMD